MRHLVFLLFFVPWIASAQLPRTCRILFLGAPDNAPKTLQLFDGKDSQEVELPKINLSKVYQLPAGAITIRMLATAPAKPEDISPDAPKANIPETMTDCYLLVSSDPANTIAPVRMQVIDANSSNFKNGQMLWYNLTDNIVGGQVGSERITMKEQSRVLLDAPASGTDDYEVKLSFVAPGEKQSYPLFEGKWAHDSRTRTILFVIPDPGSRAPRIMGFPDYREPDGKKNP